jgi:hypothetical protein
MENDMKATDITGINYMVFKRSSVRGNDIWTVEDRKGHQYGPSYTNHQDAKEHADYLHEIEADKIRSDWRRHYA